MKPSKPEPEALTDKQRWHWQRIHDLALDRASAIVGKPGQEHAAKELVVMAGIAKDKLKPALTPNYWLPEMDKRFCELRNQLCELRNQLCELRNQLVAQLPWYRRWFCN